MWRGSECRSTRTSSAVTGGTTAKKNTSDEGMLSQYPTKDSKDSVDKKSCLFHGGRRRHSCFSSNSNNDGSSSLSNLFTKKKKKGNKKKKHAVKKHQSTSIKYYTKPRGCICCKTPLEASYYDRHPFPFPQQQQQNQGKHQQRHPQQRLKYRRIPQPPPLWESDGQPGLGWWSDAEHAAQAAALQFEQATKDAEKKSKQHPTCAQADLEEEKDNNNIIIQNGEVHDLFGGGLLGDIILPRAKPITCIQDQHLAKQIASFAKARAQEASKNRCRCIKTPMSKTTTSTSNTDRQCIDDVHKDTSSTTTTTTTTTNSHADAMGLFEYDELELGDLLGIGGFSHVYEIKGFKLKQNSGTIATTKHKKEEKSINDTSSVPDIKTRRGSGEDLITFVESPVTKKASSLTPKKVSDYSEKQKLAREFLAQHALRPLDGEEGDPTTNMDQNNVVAPSSRRPSSKSYEFDDPFHSTRGVETKHDEDDDPLQLHSRRRSSSVMMLPAGRRQSRHSSLLSHSREESSAMFRETRESVSTHLMETSTAFFSKEFQDELNQAAGRNMISRYAVKHLKPSLLQEMPLPNKFAKAAMDLACEAEMMLYLEHPNIVKLRGWATGGPGNYKDGKHTSYFLIMDRLMETLQDRLAIWRKEYDERYCWKRRVKYWWKKGKKVAGNCLKGKPLRKGMRNSSKKKRRRGRDSYGSSSGSFNPNKTDNVGTPFGKSSSSNSFQRSPAGSSSGGGGASTTTSAGHDELLIERIKVAYDLACAIEYLHENRIIFRDLKSSNIGFNVRGDVQIFDFGLARYLPTNRSHMQCDQQAAEGKHGGIPEDFPGASYFHDRYSADEQFFQMSHVGTRRYTAPEVDQKLPYNLKADVYSFGVVLWEIMSMATAISKGKHGRQLAAQDLMHGSQMSSVRRPSASHNPNKSKKKKMNRRSRLMVPCPCWPLPLQQLVKSMMAMNPNDRPTMKYVRTVLEEVLLSVTTGSDASSLDALNSQELYLLKRQRRRSTYRFENWTKEEIENFLIEEDEDDDDDDDDSRNVDFTGKYKGGIRTATVTQGDSTERDVQGNDNVDDISQSSHISQASLSQ